jgi:YHS domain-containing protein
LCVVILKRFVNGMMLQVAYYSLESGADGVLGSSDYTSTITDTDGNSYSFYFSAEANKVLFEASPTSYLPKVVVICCGIGLLLWIIIIIIIIIIASLIFISVLTHTHTHTHTTHSSVSTEVFVLGELQKRVGGLKNRLDQRK